MIVGTVDDRAGVINDGQSARPCFEANQTTNRPIGNIFKGFRPTLCQPIADKSEIWLCKYVCLWFGNVAGQSCFTQEATATIANC